MDTPTEFTPLVKLDRLQELSRDLRWAGGPRAKGLWKKVDPRQWGSTENLWFILHTVSVATQLELLNGADFARELMELLEIRRHDIESPKWFEREEAANLSGNVRPGVAVLLELGLI
jgi:hypothetical protein